MCTTFNLHSDCTPVAAQSWPWTGKSANPQLWKTWSDPPWTGHIGIAPDKKSLTSTHSYTTTRLLKMKSERDESQSCLLVRLHGKCSRRKEGDMHRFLHKDMSLERKLWKEWTWQGWIAWQLIAHCVLGYDGCYHCWGNLSCINVFLEFASSKGITWEVLQIKERCHAHILMPSRVSYKDNLKDLKVEGLSWSTTIHLQCSGLWW
jgi:hypothetical protein